MIEGHWDRPGAQVSWAPDEETRAVAREYFDQVFAPPDVGRLMQGIATDPVANTNPAGHVYDEAIVELIRLLEEFRLGVSVGAMYARGVRDRVHTLRDAHKEWPHNIGMPPKVMALLSSHVQNTHGPEELNFDPLVAMAGQRVLGGWWAAQLVDSAIIRGIAILDRIAILLFSFARRLNGNWMPAFRPKDLGKLSADFASDPEWESLVALSTNEVFLFVKEVRDGHVHHRRLPAELHGDFIVSARDADGRIGSAAGADPDLHLAIATALFKDVICPVIAGAGALIARRTLSFEDR